MPPPVIRPCGGMNQPACPPTPAIVIEGVAYFTLEQMHEQSAVNYAKGIKEHAGHHGVFSAEIQNELDAASAAFITEHPDVPVISMKADDL